MCAPHPELPSNIRTLIYQAKSPALVIHARESTRPAELEINIGDILFLHRRLRWNNNTWFFN